MILFLFPISSRAIVVRSDTVWFKDDNALTYTMCEDRLYFRNIYIEAFNENNLCL